MYSVTDVNQPNTYRTWLHEYPAGQTVDLYGYAVSLAAAEPRGQPWVTFNNYPLSGQVPTPINPWDFLHVQGQFVENASGQRTLNIISWEATGLQDEYLTGMVQRVDGQAYLESEGRRLLLPDFPVDVPADEPVNVRGVTLSSEPAQFVWWLADAGVMPNFIGYSFTCGGGGGGGGGGGEGLPSSFGGGTLLLPALTQTAPREFTPTPDWGPLTPGSSLAGIEGTLQIGSYRLADGSSRWEFILIVPSGVTLPDGAALKLEGAPTAGLEQYANLPVRVTGVVEGLDQGSVVVNLESFEPVYPGVTVQPYVGKQTLETLDNTPVVVLTTENGERYVLKSSINFGQGLLIGTLDDLVEIEGYTPPDQKFGGLPVLVENAGHMQPDYKVESGVNVMDSGRQASERTAQRPGDDRPGGIGLQLNLARPLPAGRLAKP